MFFNDEMIKADEGIKDGKVLSERLMRLLAVVIVIVLLSLAGSVLAGMLPLTDPALSPRHQRNCQAASLQIDGANLLASASVCL